MAETEAKRTKHGQVRHAQIWRDAPHRRRTVTTTKKKEREEHEKFTRRSTTMQMRVRRLRSPAGDGQ